MDDSCSSPRDSTAEKVRYTAESRAAHRAELKSAVLNYFEHAQRLQGGLDARERGEPLPDLKRLIEDVWLAEKTVEIISSDALRDRIIEHARGLHRAVRDPGQLPGLVGSLALRCRKRC